MIDAFGDDFCNVEATLLPVVHRLIYVRKKYRINAKWCTRAQNVLADSVVTFAIDIMRVVRLMVISSANFIICFTYNILFCEKRNHI